MDFLKKLQNLPDFQKKIILYSLLALVGIALTFFWAKSVLKGFENIKNANLKINFPPEIEDQMSKFQQDIGSAGKQIEDNLTSTTTPPIEGITPIITPKTNK
jgi:hypothetical protein